MTVARCGTAERPSASASGQVYDYLKFESPVANSSLSSSLSRNFKIRRCGLWIWPGVSHELNPTNFQAR